MNSTRNARPRDYLSMVDVPAREALLAMSDYITAGAGETLMAQGDKSGDVLFVLSGLAKLVVRGPNRQKVMRGIIGPGEAYNVAAFLTGEPARATADAIEWVEAFRVPKDELDAWLARFPDAADRLHRHLARCQIESEDDWIAGASTAVHQRLARFLVRLADGHGQPDPERGVRVVWLSQSELAGCVGGSVRSVTRAMASWRNRDIVGADRRRSIIIRDPDKLRQIAGAQHP